MTEILSVYLLFQNIDVCVFVNTRFLNFICIFTIHRVNKILRSFGSNDFE